MLHRVSLACAALVLASVSGTRVYADAAAPAAPATLVLTGAPLKSRVLLHSAKRARTYECATPCTLGELPPGAYQLLVEHRAHAVRRLPLTLAPGERRVQRLRLTALAALLPGVWRAPLRNTFKLAHRNGHTVELPDFDVGTVLLRLGAKHRLTLERQLRPDAEAAVTRALAAKGLSGAKINLGLGSSSWPGRWRLSGDQLRVSYEGGLVKGRTTIFRCRLDEGALTLIDERGQRQDYHRDP